MRTRHAGAVIFFTLFLASITWAQVPGTYNAITDVPGIKVGHFTGDCLTGTTVVLADKGGQGVAGEVTQRGGAPGTRENGSVESGKFG